MAGKKTPPSPLTANSTERGHASIGSWLGQVTDDEVESSPDLRWPHSIRVFDRMRREESQVVSVLRAVKLPIRRAEWQIDPAGADQEVTDFIAANLGLPVKGQDPAPSQGRTKGRFSFSDHLRLALLYLDFGHMFFEQVYRIDEQTGQAWLRKLGPRLPRTIEEIKVDPDGGLRSIRQYPAGAAPASDIPVSALVAYVNDREGSNWLGMSMLRPAYKNWALKDILLRVQAETVDRNGMGVPVYEAAEGETDLSHGQKLAQAWRSGNNAGAAIPSGAKMTLQGVSGTLPDADKPIRYHDEQMARAVLAHFLNLGTQTGSWALGSTFADFFTLSLQAVADEVAHVITQHVVEDLVDINFGETVTSPRVVCAPIGSTQNATAQALQILVNAGLLTPDEALERFVRSTYQLPPAADGTDSPAPTTEGNPKP